MFCDWLRDCCVLTSRSFFELIFGKVEFKFTAQFKTGVWEFWWPPNICFLSIDTHHIYFPKDSHSPFGNAAKTLLTLKNTYLWKSSILINYMELCMMTIHSIRGNNVDYSTPLFLRVPSLPAVRVLTFIQSTVGSIMRLHHSLWDRSMLRSE